MRREKLISPAQLSATIRAADSADAASVSSVLQEAARWLTNQKMPLWDVNDLTVEKLLPEISRFFILTREDTVVGVMKFQTEDTMFWPEVPAGESAFIHRLAVRRASAGKGVSHALLEFAVQKATSLGKTFLRLDCAVDRTKLRQIYESFGFTHHSDKRVGPFNVARYEYRLRRGP